MVIQGTPQHTPLFSSDDNKLVASNIVSAARVHSAPDRPHPLFTLSHAQTPVSSEISFLNATFWMICEHA